MIITICPRCGSMNVTTTCTKCGWSQLTKSTVSTGVYKTIGELEIKMSGKALLDDYKRLLFENRSLTERIAELESAQRWVPVSERLPEAKGHYMAVVVDGFDNSRSVETLRYFGDGDWFTWSDWYVVTHWKEKPELPEVTE